MRKRQTIRSPALYSLFKKGCCPHWP